MFLKNMSLICISLPHGSIATVVEFEWCNMPLHMDSISENFSYLFKDTVQHISINENVIGLLDLYGEALPGEPTNP